MDLAEWCCNFDFGNVISQRRSRLSPRVSGSMHLLKYYIDGAARKQHMITLEDAIDIDLKKSNANSKSILVGTKIWVKGKKCKDICNKHFIQNHGSSDKLKNLQQQWLLFIHLYPEITGSLAGKTMNTTPHQHIPIHATPDDRLNRPHVNEGRQLRRHHTARYYVHRVKESLTTRVSKLICSVFLSLLFIVGLITFILWLSLRPHRPRYHIHEFSIPAIAQDNGFATAQATFNVTARNPNLNIGIYYDTMHLTLYYQDQNIGEMPLLNPFYQSPKNTTILYGTFSGPTLVVDTARWTQFVADRMRGMVSFRLEVVTTMRFKVATWESKNHKMHANCLIGVGPDGTGPEMLCRVVLVNKTNNSLWLQVIARYDVKAWDRRHINHYGSTIRLDLHFNSLWHVTARYDTLRHI
ncbi:hypothetical protein OSB04_008154 [Centaurea solstitialis]|uniref:Late embryogenesis abundant protein LEA-2 subgroup domain-containing protein n=1 Tax=Centaurea solstitialis TaxID=347529 RepID=A0AA38TL91_9ASTR|nr:hypothetical protein OSB04_008154 [Centaurea solstitialis]